MSGGAGEVIQDVLRAGKDLWPILFGPAGLGLLVLTYRALRELRTAERRDRGSEQSAREAREVAREQTRLDGIATQERDARALLDAAFARQRQEIADLHADYERLEAQHVAVCRDRDRGWHLARVWHRKAHDMRHDAANLWVMVERAAPAAGLPLPARPGLMLPDHLEDPP